MQFSEKDDIIARMLYYWARLYARQMKKGNKDMKLDKTIAILIADFEIKGLEELTYHTKWRLREENNRKIVLTDLIEFHILEIPKIKREANDDSELRDWLEFLENPNSERVRKKMEENKELKEAHEKLVGLSEEEEMQWLADLRQKAIWDENSIRATGERVGREQGEAKKQKEIAKKMLAEKLDIKLIAKITELTEEEIKKL